MDNLERFIKAQERDYDMALKEIRIGHKYNHWMWYIFPQLEGLGGSEMSYFYSIKSLEEARCYLDNEILRGHLMEISEALLKLDSNDILDILGYPDNLKLKSCMTLFLCVEPENVVFKKVLEKFYNGKEDSNTLNLIKLMNEVKK